MRTQADLGMVKKFKAYRDVGLSYRDISKLLNKELKTLVRYNTYIKKGYLESVGKDK